MKFLKGLALSILSLLLFLSLSAFGLAITLNHTVLNPEFVVSQVDRLDISSLAKEVLREQVSQGGEFMAEFVDDAIVELEPWIKEQARTVIYASYDYLLGKRQDMSVTISLEPVKQNLKETVRQAVLQSPPPELAGLPPALIEQHFDEYYQGFSKEIPPTFELSEKMLPAGVITQVEQVRQVIGYLQTGDKALIGFIAFLILCMVLIKREVKGTTRSLGSSFLSYGATTYAGILVAKYFAGRELVKLDIPIFIQEWLPQLIGDSLAPLEKFSMWVLIGGIALLVVSFVYRRQQSSL